MWSFSTVVLGLLPLLCVTEGYRILVIFPHPSTSHAIIGNSYVRELLDAGHEVTYITRYPKENPPAGLTEIDVSGVRNTLPATSSSFAQVLKGVDVEVRLTETCSLPEDVVRSEAVQALLRDVDVSFDAVIAEWLGSELYAGFAALYQCPLIWAWPIGMNVRLYSLMDATQNPAYTRDPWSQQIPPFTFFQRITALIRYFRSLYIFHFKALPKADRHYEEVFRPAGARRGLALPPFRDVVYNASMAFLYSHHLTDGASRLPQNVKPIGGMHLQYPIPPLEDKLETLLDKSYEGVILFSMGSVLRIEEMSVDMKIKLFEMFGQLKQTVIFRMNGTFANVPRNVHVFPWIPQLSILSHPHTRLFITHGGMLSVTEAMVAGVPMVGVPMFADQFTNVLHAVSNGVAEMVRADEDLAGTLKPAVHQVLANPRYGLRAKELSTVYQKLQLTPGDDFNFWLDYTISTGGAPSLRSAALPVPWYQKAFLDVAAFFVFILSVVVLLLRRFASMLKSVNIFGKKRKTT